MNQAKRIKLLKWFVFPFIACGYATHFFILGFNTGRQAARRHIGAWLRGEQL